MKKAAKAKSETKTEADTEVKTAAAIDARTKTAGKKPVRVVTERDPATAAPLLKDIFDPARLRHIAAETAAVYPDFDRKRFLKTVQIDYDALSLMERLHRVVACLQPLLPDDYPAALKVLRQLAPRLNSKFVTMILPHYVALYGTGHFDLSMDALKFFTGFGSSEFGVRHFIRHDPARALAIMTVWSTDADEHVRRLASEGSRPRLPWSFRITPLCEDPTPAAAIIENLRADPSLYVRKSVANHLNDITKDNPAWVLDRLAHWPRDNPHTVWIMRHALRTLIKRGDRRALELVGVTGAAALDACTLTVTPQKIRLGEQIRLSVQLSSASAAPQKLVIDYAVHYVKKGGHTSAKVFKLKTVTLPPAGEGGALTVARSQAFRDFTTRDHYAGRHEIELFVNGVCLARGYFMLQA